MPHFFCSRATVAVTCVAESVAVTLSLMFRKATWAGTAAWLAVPLSEPPFAATTARGPPTISTAAAATM